MAELYRLAEAAILERDTGAKCRAASRLFRQWKSGHFDLDTDYRVLPIDDAGRPRSPRLVDPRQLPRRSFATVEGRICLLHSFAHIEFNAINIALDAVYRFRAVPADYIGDWLQVAAEEAHHFTILESELLERGSYYGALDAHGGLWDMVCKTRSDALHRMALVPRVMEARGLDVTPGMMKRFSQFGDCRAAAILEIIYRDEIGHVRIGNRWYEWFCRQRGLDGKTTFRQLIDEYMGGRLRGPFNRDARVEAGFDTDELADLERND